jgi:hypothetical protein
VQIFDSAPACTNSFGYSQGVFLTMIKDYLKGAHIKEFGRPLPEEGDEGWYFHRCPSNNTIVPQQGASNDCGVFLCYFMDLLMDNCPITELTQEAIAKNGRNWIGATILDNKFNY